MGRAACSHRPGCRLLERAVRGRRRDRRRVAVDFHSRFPRAFGDGHLARVDRPDRARRVDFLRAARRPASRLRGPARDPGCGWRDRWDRIATAPCHTGADAQLRRVSRRGRNLVAPMTIALAVALGLLAGVLAGLYGVGGGVLFVPTLVIVFGLDQVDAEATSLLAILPTVAAGAWRQHRYGNIRWRAAAVDGFASIVGVELGVLAAKGLPEHTLQRLFGLLVLVVAAQLAWRARRILSP